MEISLSTLAYDRSDKASLYASAGIEDYWVIDIEGRQIEAHRRPVPDDGRPFGFGYADVVTYKAGDMISPLGKAEAQIAVADLLP